MFAVGMFSQYSQTKQIMAKDLARGRGQIFTKRQPSGRFNKGLEGVIGTRDSTEISLPQSLFGHSKEQQWSRQFYDVVFRQC